MQSCWSVEDCDYWKKFHWLSQRDYQEMKKTLFLIILTVRKTSHFSFHSTPLCQREKNDANKINEKWFIFCSISIFLVSFHCFSSSSWQLVCELFSSLNYKRALEEMNPIWWLLAIHYNREMKFFSFKYHNIAIFSSVVISMQFLI